jgi:hypothetical protein
MKNQLYLLSLAALFAVPSIAQIAQPAPGAPAATEAVADPAVQPAAPATPATGGRRVKRDANRPIAVLDTVNYDDPDNPGVINNCTVLGVLPGAYKLRCLNLNPMYQIIRDIDVKRPGGQAPQTSAVGPATAPFKPNDLVLATTMGLMEERYWKLCIVVRNTVRTNNSYVVDCGSGETNVLPSWVRTDPEFE